MLGFLRCCKAGALAASFAPGTGVGPPSSESDADLTEPLGVSMEMRSKSPASDLLLPAMWWPLQHSECAEMLFRALVISMYFHVKGFFIICKVLGADGP